MLQNLSRLVSKLRHNDVESHRRVADLIQDTCFDDPRNRGVKKVFIDWVHIEAKEKTLRFQRSLGNCGNVAVVYLISLSLSFSIFSYWAAEALAPVGSLGTHISGQPRYSR